MKTLLIAAVSAAALTAPAFADTANYARLHFAMTEQGDGAYRVGEPTSTGDVAYAIEHFAQDDTGDGAGRYLIPVSGDATLSTSNNDTTAIARAVLDTGERGDNN